MSKQDNTTNNYVLEQNTGVEELIQQYRDLPEEENEPDKCISLGDIKIMSGMNASKRESTETEACGQSK